MKLLSIIILVSCMVLGVNDAKESKEDFTVESTVLTPKEQAFSILKTKCNVCHQNRNRRMVFTLDNMDDLAYKINQQVFIKKRMPKGNKITLTANERAQLKKWVDSVK